MDVFAREGYGRYIGRVGALAVALGVGMAVAATQGAAVAGAETGTGSSDSSTESSAQDDAGSAATTRTPDSDGPADEVAGDRHDDEESGDEQADDVEPAEEADGGDESDGEESDGSIEDDPPTGESDGAIESRPDRDDAQTDVDPAVADLDDARYVRVEVPPETLESVENGFMAEDLMTVESTTAHTAEEAQDPEDPPATAVKSLVVPTVVPAAPVAPAPNLLSWLTGFFAGIQRTFFNRAPDARNQRVTIALGKPEDISDPFALLARDRDGDAMTFSLVGNRGPRHGTVTFDQATGSFVYNPDDAFARTGGTDKFTYKVSDATASWHLPGLVSFLTKPDFGHADIATVTITLAPTVRSGIDLGNIDDSVRLQDDPFGWLLGKWLKNHEIPADRAIDGLMLDLEDKVSKQIRDLIEELERAGAEPGTDAQRIADLFASYTDTATIAEVGLAPLLAELARIDDATDSGALTAVLGSLVGVNTGVSLDVEIDVKDSSRRLVELSQAGLGLPERSYYSDPRYADILTAYPGHIAKMFALVYGGTADEYLQSAHRIVALESKLAAAHWDIVRSRDPELTYNLRSLADLVAEAPGFDWGRWLDARGVPAAHTTVMMVDQPDFLTAFAQAWSAESLQDWKDYLRWQTIHARAFLLTDDLVDEDFAFFRQRLNGVEQNSSREQRALEALDNILGFAVGKLYVEKHFPQEAKRQIEEMVDNLIEAYRDSIRELDWMTPETRAKALEKLDKLTVKVGYPDSWVDYSGLVVDRGDLYGNVVRGIANKRQSDLDNLGKPIDRSVWGMTPQTVNAYYSPTMNEIVFPAAHLMAPFFDPEADLAASYGGIGATIGHEIGHAFDDNGSRYDGDGNLVDWWTAVDRAAFEAKTAVLVEQFDGYVPRQLPGGPHVNGTLTLGENIADLGGLAIALKAYTTSLDGKPDPVIDGYTGTQRVLLGYVQSWQLKARDAEVLRRLATDPHSPPEFRVNGILRNLDAFYDAFGVDESSPLWVAPEDRVRIWY